MFGVPSASSFWWSYQVMLGRETVDRSRKPAVPTNAAYIAAGCIQAHAIDYTQLGRGYLVEHHQHDVGVADWQSGGCGGSLGLNPQAGHGLAQSDTSDRMGTARGQIDRSSNPLYQ